MAWGQGPVLVCLDLVARVAFAWAGGSFLMLLQISLRAGVASRVDYNRGLRRIWSTLYYYGQILHHIFYVNDIMLLNLAPDCHFC